MRNELNLKLTGAAVAFALAGLAGTTHAGVPGYVSDTANTIWTSPYGLCWKTTDWTPEKAAVPCDAVRVVNAPPPPPVAVAAPPPAPPPIIEQISLSSDVLFEFNKAELRPSGRQKLDEISDRLKGANVQLINTIGHADRIGSDDYNKQLSEKRAASVKEYLAQKGVDQAKVRSEGRGESQPVTGEQCKGLSGEKLIACLQPDRRVDIEVRGERQVAGTPTPAGAGATGAPSSGATSGSSAAASSGSTSSSGMSPASPSGSSGSSGSSK